MTINDGGNNLNGANMSDKQVQFAGDPAEISHQNLLSIRKIRIRHEELPLLNPPTERIIGVKNRMAFTISAGFVQAPQALKTPTTEEVILVTTAFNKGANKTPRIFFRTEIYGTKPATSSSGISAVVSCPSPTPPSGCIWKGSIGNIRLTTTPNFSKSSEFNTPIDIILINDYIFPSFRSTIHRDKFSGSFNRYI